MTRRARTRWVPRSDWTPSIEVARRYGYPIHWVEVEVSDPDIEMLRSELEALKRHFMERPDRPKDDR